MSFKLIYASFLKKIAIVEKDNFLSEKITFVKKDRILPQKRTFYMLTAKNCFRKAYLMLAPLAVYIHEWQQCIVSLSLLCNMQNLDQILKCLLLTVQCYIYYHKSCNLPKIIQIIVINHVRPFIF